MSLTAVPINHLEQVNETDWTSIGIDPVFSLEFPRRRVPRGWVLIEIEIDRLGPEQLVPCLYIDDGAGFREETRVQLPAPKGGVITDVIKLPNGVAGLRFDPTDGPGRFRLRGLRLRRLWPGEVRRQKPLRSWSRSMAGLVARKTGPSHARSWIGLDMLPVKDLALEADFVWRSLGDDPIFYLNPPTPAFPSGWLLIEIEIEKLGTGYLQPRLYVDDGQGYREQTQILLPNPRKGLISHIICLPEGIKGVRFDPTDGQCRFHLGEARIRRLFPGEWYARLIPNAVERAVQAGEQRSTVLKRLLKQAASGAFAEIDKALVEINQTVQNRSGYGDWLIEMAPAVAADLAEKAEKVESLAFKPTFSIVMPTYNSPEKWLILAIESVRRQIYPHWELCICDDASTSPVVRRVLSKYAAEDSRIKVVYRQKNGHIALATNDAMALASGEYICLMDHDDEIEPNSLYEFAAILNEDPAVDFIYSDEDKISIGGVRYEPFFKPDWSPELLESCMYTAHFACYRRDISLEIGGFRSECNGAQDYDFVLRYTEKAMNVRHLERILYHWRAIPGSTAQSMDSKSYVIDAAIRALTDRCRRTGEPDVVRSTRFPGSFEVRRKIVGEPLVSIVIPTAGRDSTIRGATVDLLVHCIRSIVEKSTYRRVEFIVVDNGDLRASTTEALADVPIRYVTFPEPKFNVAKKMNLGARHAAGDLLLFLNDDIELISPDWLEAMIAVAQRPGVGVVGAKLLFEDGTLQHVGVNFSDGWPDHTRRGYPGLDHGYMFSTVASRNLLAVTGACAMVPRDVFWDVGGFDEKFEVNYNDIDLCLRIHETGRRIVYTPQAELHHYESQNRERSVEPEALALWSARWEEKLKADPFYPRMMQVKPPTFELDFTRTGYLP